MGDRSIGKNADSVKKISHFNEVFFTFYTTKTADVRAAVFVSPMKSCKLMLAFNLRIPAKLPERM